MHSFQRDVPVPAPMAWSYRLGKRIPGFPTIDLTGLMATELRRDGLDVSVCAQRHRTESISRAQRG